MAWPKCAGALRLALYPSLSSIAWGRPALVAGGVQAWYSGAFPAPNIEEWILRAGWPAHVVP